MIRYLKNCYMVGPEDDGNNGRYCISYASKDAYHEIEEMLKNGHENLDVIFEPELVYDPTGTWFLNLRITKKDGSIEGIQ